jgi:GNAT superfamily N-acetyltransferase
MTEIHTSYIPGLIGRVVEMHGQYYADDWKFGSFFEAKVATGMSEFITRYDPERDAVWSVVHDGRIEGSITIDGIHARDEGAHLRWFIMSDVLRGQGFGQSLLHEATMFCKARNYPAIYLWTFAGLHAARKLYEKAGFVMVHEEKGTQWGTEVTEQKFILELA